MPGHLVHQFHVCQIHVRHFQSTPFVVLLLFHSFLFLFFRGLLGLYTLKSVKCKVRGSGSAPMGPWGEAQAVAEFRTFVV